MCFGLRNLATVPIYHSLEVLQEAGEHDRKTPVALHPELALVAVPVNLHARLNPRCCSGSWTSLAQVAGYPSYEVTECLQGWPLRPLWTILHYVPLLDPSSGSYCTLVGGLGPANGC